MNTDFAEARIYSDLSGLNDIKLAAKNDRDGALGEIATQFESMFLKMILKTMREASLSSDLFDSNQMDAYQEMYDNQISLHLAERTNIGLADMLVRQLGGSTETDKQTTLAPLPAVTHSFPTYRNIPPQRQMEINRINTRQTLTDKNGINSEASAFRQISKEQFSDPESFVNELRPIAEKYAKELGVEPEVLLAQAALETGWGKKIIHSGNGESSHNLFGIKASNNWQGETNTVKTLEYRNDEIKYESASFRSYDSFEQSFKDYVAFIKTNGRYQEALNQANSAPNYLNALQTAGYATDPAYAEKIISILERDYF